MFFQSRLIKAKLIRRYKRVLADVLLENGDYEVAYCPNFGAMVGLTQEDSDIWLSISDNKNRKNKLIWELCLSSGGLVGINTKRALDIVIEAIELGRIAEFLEYDKMSKKIKNSGFGSKIDILLQKEETQEVCYVGVSNIYMKRKTEAVFPDSVMLSDIKQIQELTQVAKEGARAVLFCLAQRMDCLGAKVVWDTNPDYTIALSNAIKNGVEVICYSCMIDLYGIWIDRRLELDFKF